MDEPQLPLDDVDAPLRALADFGAAPAGAAGAAGRGQLRLRREVDINPRCRPVLPSRLDGGAQAHTNAHTHADRVRIEYEAYSQEAQRNNTQEVYDEVVEPEPDYQGHDMGQEPYLEGRRGATPVHYSMAGTGDSERWNFKDHNSDDYYAIEHDAPGNDMEQRYYNRKYNHLSTKDYMEDFEDIEDNDAVITPRQHVRTPTRIIKRSQSYNPSKSERKVPLSVSTKRRAGTCAKQSRSQVGVYPYGDECMDNTDGMYENRGSTPPRTQMTASGTLSEHHLKVPVRNYTPGEVIPPHVAKNLREKKARRADPVSSYAKYRNIWSKNRTSTSKK